MSILDSILNVFVENNASANRQKKTLDTTASREIIVKHNGRLQRITLNKYGEIIDRRGE